MMSHHSIPNTQKLAFKQGHVPQTDQLSENGILPIPFRFDEQVAQVFDDMVIRSIPGYERVQELLLYWVKHHYRENTILYDLGCSTANVICYLHRNLPKQLQSVGVDCSLPMIHKAMQKTSLFIDEKIQLYCEDIKTTSLENAGFVVLNYTLQFIPVQHRLKILYRIHKSLDNQGILFLSEKLQAETPGFQQVFHQIHEDFKLQNGYSKNAIAQKKTALEHVLIPLTFSEQYSLLREAGFNKIQPIFMWNNFCTFVCQS